MNIRRGKRGRLRAASLVYQVGAKMARFSAREMIESALEGADVQDVDKTVDRFPCRVDTHGDGYGVRDDAPCDVPDIIDFNLRAVYACGGG